MVVGWGTTDPVEFTPATALQYAFLTPVPRPACQQKYSQFLGGVMEEIFIHRTVLCAGDERADACKVKMRHKSVDLRILRPECQHSAARVYSL